MTVELLTVHHLEFLSLTGSCTVSSESTLSKCYIVGNHVSRLIYQKVQIRLVTAQVDQSLRFFASLIENLPALIEKYPKIFNK